MPTKHPRIHVTLEENLYGALALIAAKQEKSLSHMAKDLIQEALDSHEDLLLSELATHREEQRQKIIPHDKAWK